ncbi:MAG TPA: S1-like domain-containing RNA-binding protein [Prolixibacteraceae bacterium]|nr:S1-like domain-containing RNA-binding protein [Prolixibacteraceae bacterium]
MVRIGKTSTLEIVKFTESGAYLDGGPYGEILLPKRYVQEQHTAGDELEVFVYFDSEDRLVATTEQPLARVGECAFLEVVDVAAPGAFLDWGLQKNLLVPYREQAVRMEVGKRYLVRVYVDERSGRIAASSRIDRFLNQDPLAEKPGDEVDLLIARKTELGWMAVIHHTHSGILYFNELFQPVAIGDCCKGYIRKIRSDGKIDLSLERFGYQKVDAVLENILDKLKASGGFLPFTDHSDPESIQKVFGISKKTFKKAIGALYKNRLLAIEGEGIRLL